jgi:hypothetical protein
VEERAKAFGSPSVARSQGHDEGQMTKAEGSRTEGAAHDGPRNTDHASRFTLHVSGYYLLALFCFGLGLMCKPMLVTWPFVMLRLDYRPLDLAWLLATQAQLSKA